MRASKGRHFPARCWGVVLAGVALGGCSSQAKTPPEPPAPACIESLYKPSALPVVSAPAASASGTPVVGVSMLPLMSSAPPSKGPAAVRLAQRFPQNEWFRVLQGKGEVTWVLPKSVPRGQSLARIEGSAVRPVWAAPITSWIDGATDNEGNVWVVAAPAERDVFSFESVKRLAKFSPSGKLLVDVPLAGGPFKLDAIDHDAAGRISLLGVLAGPLETANGTVAPPDRGRSWGVIRLGTGGQPAWATVVGPGRRGAPLLASLEDGGVAVVHEQTAGEQELMFLDASGKIRHKRAFLPTASPFSGLPLRWLVSDGHGGVLAGFEFSGEVIVDFGTGPLRGENLFLARFDAEGKFVWGRALPPLSRLVADHAGSAILLSEVQNGQASVIEFDADGKEHQHLAFEVPDGCSDMRVTLDVSITTTHLALLFSCQKYDDGYRPVVPVGLPSLWLATVPRK